MKIVVSWYSGSEFNGCTCHTLLEYESTEKLYCELEEATLKFIEKNNANYKAYQLIRNEHDLSNKNEKAQDKFFKAHAEIMKNYPAREIVIGGVNFHLCDFCDNNKWNPPEIQELNEWFEANRDDF